MSKVIPAVGDALSNEHYIPAATIVMRHGPAGTAYQKHASDGLFHTYSGVALVQNQLVASNATVVYVPPLSQSDQKEILADEIVFLFEELETYGEGDFTDKFSLLELTKLCDALKQALSKVEG